jgi:hypothetical protein
VNFNFTISLVLFFAVWSAHAADNDVFTRIHHQYSSSRALGMGNGFVALANDYSALYYNPAGLARLEDGQINMSMEAGYSPSAIQFYKDLKSLESDTVKSTDSEKFTKYADFLDSRYGSYYQAKASVFNGIWVRPNWGVGVIPVDLTLEIGIHKQATPTINLKLYQDTSITIGYGKDIKGYDGRWSWGVAGKFVNRAYYTKQVNSLDLAVDSSLIKSSDLNEGYTIDADLGVLYTPTISPAGYGYMFTLAKPTFGAVLRNVGELGFKNSLKLINKTVTDDRPEKLYRVLDVGAKFEYPSVWIFGGRGVLDIKDIGHPSINSRKALHTGFEFDWSVASWWKGQYRFGLNQGYFTAGFSALFTIFRLDFATYGEDVGSTGAPKENRMYLVKMNLDF